MFDVILKRMREAVREGRYITTIHADEEMDEDDLTILDVENGILTGEILERQKDHLTGEWKYRIRGNTSKGTNRIEVIAKLSLTGRLVIITVYAIWSEDDKP
jgi:hypothetical protein